MTGVRGIIGLGLVVFYGWVSGILRLGLEIF